MSVPSVEPGAGAGAGPGSRGIDVHVPDANLSPTTGSHNTPLQPILTTLPLPTTLSTRPLNPPSQPTTGPHSSTSARGANWPAKTVSAGHITTSHRTLT